MIYLSLRAFDNPVSCHSYYIAPQVFHLFEVAGETSCFSVTWHPVGNHMGVVPFLPSSTKSTVPHKVTTQGIACSYRAPSLASGTVMAPSAGDKRPATSLACAAVLASNAGAKRPAAPVTTEENAGAKRPAAPVTTEEKPAAAPPASVEPMSVEPNADAPAAELLTKPPKSHMLHLLSECDEVAFDDGEEHVGNDKNLTLTLVRAGNHALNNKLNGGGLIKLYASLYGTEDHEFREPVLTSALARQSYFTIVALGPRGGIRGAATIRMFLFVGELVSEIVMLLVKDKKRRLGSRLVEAAKSLHRQECARLDLKGQILALPLDWIAEKTFSGSRGFRSGAEPERDALYDALGRNDGLLSFKSRGIDVKDKSAVAAEYIEWKGNFDGLDLEEQKRRYAEGFRWNTLFPETAYSWRDEPSSDDQGGGDEGGGGEDKGNESCGDGSNDGGASGGESTGERDSDRANGETPGTASDLAGDQPRAEARETVLASNAGAKRPAAPLAPRAKAPDARPTPPRTKERDTLYNALRRDDGLLSFTKRGIDVKDEGGGGEDKSNESRGDGSNNGGPSGGKSTTPQRMMDDTWSTAEPVRYPSSSSAEARETELAPTAGAKRPAAPLAPRAKAPEDRTTPPGMKDEPKSTTGHVGDPNGQRPTWDHRLPDDPKAWVNARQLRCAAAHSIADVTIGTTSNGTAQTMHVSVPTARVAVTTSASGHVGVRIGVPSRQLILCEPLSCTGDYSNVAQVLSNCKRAQAILQGRRPMDAMVLQYQQGYHWRFVALSGPERVVYYWNPYGFADAPKNLRSKTAAHGWTFITISHCLQCPVTDSYQCGPWSHVAVELFIAYFRKGDFDGFGRYFLELGLRPLNSAGLEQNPTRVANAAYIAAKRKVMREAISRAETNGTLQFGPTRATEDTQQLASPEVRRVRLEGNEPEDGIDLATPEASPEEILSRPRHRRVRPPTLALIEHTLPL